MQVSSNYVNSSRKHEPNIKYIYICDYNLTLNKCINKYDILAKQQQNIKNIANFNVVAKSLLSLKVGHIKSTSFSKTYLPTTRTCHCTYSKIRIPWTRI